MRKVIIKSENGMGNKCKTYVFECDKAILFHKYTLHNGNDKMLNWIGGETIIKKTNKYFLSFHRFSIKKSTLFTALSHFGLIENP